MKVATLLAAVGLALALFSGCVKEISLPASTELPAATGNVKVSKDENGNTKVNLKVEHFAPPDRLQPPKRLYVVWVETPQKKLYNIGQLQVDDNLRGELQTVTPYEVFRLIISAEDYATVTTIGSQVVLSTNVIDR